MCSMCLCVLCVVCVFFVLCACVLRVSSCVLVSKIVKVNALSVPMPDQVPPGRTVADFLGEVPVEARARFSGN